VTSLDAFWKTKQDGDNRDRSEPVEAIDVPQNTMIGITLSFFAVILGFAMIWHIWWMAIVGGLGFVVACLVYAWRTSTETKIPAHDLIATGVLRG
jgi:cytochrome o ubiquinol oxidase subunit 1